MVITRHRFSPEIERQLAALRKLDNWHGPLALVTDWAVIIGTIWLCERFLHGLAWWLGYLLVAVPIIATRQRALATLLHESVHGVLTRDLMLGIALSTFPSGYMILQSRRAYRRSHLRDHHGSFGNPYVDPDLRAHLSHGLYEPMSGRTFTIKYLLAPLVGWRTPQLITELVVQRLSGTPRELTASIAVLAYFLGVVAACFVAGIGQLFLVYWVVPLFLVFPLINWYLELLEHFPMVGHQYVDIMTSRPRAIGPITRNLFGIHGEGYHLDHHLSPKIPYWNLRQAHQIRMADPAYRAAVEEMAPEGRGLLWQFRDMTNKVEGGHIDVRFRGQVASFETPPETISDGAALVVGNLKKWVSSIGYDGTGRPHAPWGT